MHRIRSYAAATLVTLLGVAPVAHAALPKVAVMPLSARHVASDTSAILDDLVTEALAKTGRYEVIGVRDIEAMLGLERMKDVLGCDEVACAAELGGALGVGLLVSGSVARLGGEIMVQLSLIDVARARVIARGRGEVPDEERRFREAIELAVADLLKLDKPAPSGPPISPIRYRFETTDPARAFNVVYMASDGREHRCQKPVTVTAPCLLTGLAEGDGRLSVTSDGLGPFARGLGVDGDDELLAFKVGRRASDGSVISWTLGGVAAAVGAALLGVGIPLDKPGMVYGGAPTLAVGLGVIALGFAFDGKVAVNYPTWGLLF